MKPSFGFPRRADATVMTTIEIAVVLAASPLSRKPPYPKGQVGKGASALLLMQNAGNGYAEWLCPSIPCQQAFGGN
jgi:hypothetical protein